GTTTASSGTVTRSGSQSGTWSWTGSADEDAPYSVTISATNAGGSPALPSFPTRRSSDLPTVTADHATVSAAENAAAVNTGSFARFDDDATITPSSSAVTHSRSQGGTWSWTGSGDEDHPYSLTITATNADASSTATSFGVS